MKTSKTAAKAKETSIDDLADEPRAEPQGNLPPARIRTRAAPVPVADAGGSQPPTQPPAAPAAAQEPEPRGEVPPEPEKQAGDFAIGYKKPPKEHRWKKGVSGNPKGRTKGSKNVRTILFARLNDRVKTKVNNRTKTETALEAIIRGQVYDALTRRDHKTVVYLLGQVERLNVFSQDQDGGGEGGEGGGAPATDETDAEIVRRLMDRLMGREDEE